MLPDSQTAARREEAGASERTRENYMNVIRVWTPCWTQGVFLQTQAMWSGAFVCPASYCGSSHAAGLYGSPRIESKSAWRARSAPNNAGFPDPVSLTVCPYPWNGLLTSPTSPTVVGASSAHRVRSLVNLALCHQRPCNPSCAVRVWTPRWTARSPSNDGHRAADQQSAQFALTHLRSSA